MREHALRTGSAYQERGDKRNNPNKSRQTSGPRSKRSVNLGRLGAELGLDVLGAGLGLSEQAIKVLVEGRDHAREEQLLLT